MGTNWKKWNVSINGYWLVVLAPSTRSWSIRRNHQPADEYNEHKVWMKPNPKTENIPGDSIVAVFSGKGF